MTDWDRDQLRSIRTFPSLVRYLRDELGWPIEAENFEDITFDYQPEELGIDSKSAANIEQIKQLRPLTNNQPWGIFFIKFEPKHLPVVVLRRILGQLVIKKRASARMSEQATWHLNDILFISNYGEGESRQITFAHFTQDKELGDLPTLRVLGWDDTDTPLHIDHVHNELKAKLCWPNDESHILGWRELWCSAFTLRHREVIATSKALAMRLATLATCICRRTNQVLAIENERGPLRKLYKAFQEALVHDLKEDDFSDMYAQTIAYGLLTARVSRPIRITIDNIADMVITNPFLKEILETFLTAGGRKGKMDFDELGIQEVVELLNSPDTHMDAVLRDFGNRTQGEDPVIHFYELFMSAYDKQKKVQRGIFYTPQPVVSFIVRSVHELLQNEFGLADGLADITTWGEMAKRNHDIKIPKGISPNEPFVQVLDPATGTATFLVEVIDIIHKTIIAKWQKQGYTASQIPDLWNNYVPKCLLPRIYGFELMMAPYAIAHMKLGLKLYETGYLFGPNERINIYLTNSLEPPEDFSDQFEIMAPALAHEAKAVNSIKRNRRFTVIIGNPPYSGISANMSEAIMDLVEPYKYIDGISMGERKIWIQDDYKKFVRFAQLMISDSNIGLIGFITNHGFINEPTGRGMRNNLLQTFNHISIVDLHGSLIKREVCPDGSPDKNVFDIEPGVAISFFLRGLSSEIKVSHSDLWGTREHKYDFLLSQTLSSKAQTRVTPSADFYLFVPQSEDTKVELANFVRITDVFQVGSNGIQTSRDHIVYGFEPSECNEIIEEFRQSERVLSTNELRDKYWPGKRIANYKPGDTRGWRVAEARENLRNDKERENRFRRSLYRPFDYRTLFYADYMIDWPRTEVMQQMIMPNLSLCVGRAGSAADNQAWNIIFVANTIADMNLFYRGGNVNYPLRITAVSGGLGFDHKSSTNFKTSFLRMLAKTLDLPQSNEFDLPQSLTPEDIFYYIYAVFYSPDFRYRYMDFLKIDFPRLPLTSNIELFRALSQLGGELVPLHLMECQKLDKYITKWQGAIPSSEVEKVTYSNNTVWIDKEQSEGFHGVSENVWNFHIGGYQVCEKWLKDRKGRGLSAEDIIHYQKIIVGLNETIHIMNKIDDVIIKYGGWPGAFSDNKGQDVNIGNDLTENLEEETNHNSSLDKLNSMPSFEKPNSTVIKGIFCPFCNKKFRTENGRLWHLDNKTCQL